MLSVWRCARLPTCCYYAFSSCLSSSRAGATFTNCSLSLTPVPVFLRPHLCTLKIAGGTQANSALNFNWCCWKLRCECLLGLFIKQVSISSLIAICVSSSSSEGVKSATDGSTQVWSEWWFQNKPWSRVVENQALQPFCLQRHWTKVGLIFFTWY